MNFVDKDGTTKVYIPVHPWKLLQKNDQNVTDETVLDIAVSLMALGLKEGTRRYLVSCLLFPLILGKC